jgi:2-oxoglutarate/2-oxoacid ferredoxin oxidoreductase subunit beta
VLRKLDTSHDPTDRYAALKLLEEARQQQHFITGLIYVDGDRPSLAEHERLGRTPLAHMGQDQLRPSRQSLEKVMAGMK